MAEQANTKWYHFIMAFFAGIFIMNVFPHFINGIIGRPFPTPFADPPGKGASLPVINILWATINFVIGFALIWYGNLHLRGKYVWLVFFVAAVAMAFVLASYFGSLHITV